MEYQATTVRTSPVVQTRAADRWFYVGTAIAAIITVVVGFGPSLVDTGARNAPLTLVVAVHGVVCIAWLLLFLTQTILGELDGFACIAASGSRRRSSRLR
jgi:hypothetical protein